MVIPLQLAGKGRQRLPQGLNDGSREQVIQIGGMHTRLIRRGDATQTGGRTGRQEILQPLRRCGVTAPSKPEGALLQLPLQSNPRQRIPGEAFKRCQVIGVQSHNQTAVGVALVAGVLAHAIGHHPAFLRGGTHHKSSGTHAEAVDAAAVFSMVNQLVLGGPETRMARRLSPAGCVNQMLRMLNPHAHGKRFALQLHTDLLQHFEAVARGMTGSQHQMAAGNLRSIGQHHPIELMRLPSAAVAELKACHATVETHLTAEGFNPCPQATHHGGELEGADVGAVQREDLLAGTTGHQLLQHLAAVVLGIAHLAVELAVGEGAGSALTELGIGFRVEGAGAPPEAKGVSGALLHGLTPFQQQRSEPHLCQQQSSEITAGACPHHHRPIGRIQGEAIGGMTHRPVAGVWSQTHPAFVADAP